MKISEDMIRSAGVLSEAIYAAGYAVPSYDILAYRRFWRYRDEEFNLPANAVYLYDIGIGFDVGRIDDIRTAAHKA